MKTYTFYREFYSSVPGMEMDVYKSGDINGSWITWRSCLLAVAVEQNLVDSLDNDFITEHDLESLMIENNIYCSIVDE